MGLPFPVWSGSGSFTTLADTPQKREALKTAIRALLQYDPEIKDILENGGKLKDVREKLRKKTEHLFDPSK